MFSFTGSTGTRGVSILISNKISFDLIDLVSDKEGQYPVLYGTLQNEKCTLVKGVVCNSNPMHCLTNSGARP